MFDGVCNSFPSFALFSVFSVHTQNPQSTAVRQSGAITLDVVVTPKSRPPVAGLQQQDFTVLDNKTLQTIPSFQAVREREAPIEVILVVDDVNTGLEQVACSR